MAKLSKFQYFKKINFKVIVGSEQTQWFCTSRAANIKVKNQQTSKTSDVLGWPEKGIITQNSVLTFA